MTAVDVTAPGKLLALCMVILGCFAYILLAAAGISAVDTTPAWATLTLVTGYLIGNGTGARRGIETTPIFSPPTEADR